MKKIFKKVCNITLLSILLIGVTYFSLAPAVIQAVYPNPGPVSITASLSVTKEIDITAPGNPTLLPSILGMTGNYLAPASATAAFTVISNAAGGFDMKIYASQAHALYLGTPSDQYFADYVPVAGALATPDATWTSPASFTAWFGYSVAAGTSADADQMFKFSGTCNNGAGSNTSTNCFQGMTTTPGTRIIHRTTYTSSTGQVETVKFLAESRQDFLKEGTYTATITATVLNN
jgi:hypothetical protein